LENEDITAFKLISDLSTEIVVCSDEEKSVSSSYIGKLKREYFSHILNTDICWNIVL
jgi:hypothetical protein